MSSSRHSHPKYFQWFRNIFAILAFIYPAYMLLTSPPTNVLIGIMEIFISIIMIISILVAAYFFQDVWVDEDGLEIEFLWRKIKVRWVDIIEAKTARGFWLTPEKNRPWVVLVNGLTPFHRAFGFIYALSIKPAFVISPSISDFQVLKETIQLHIKK